MLSESQLLFSVYVFVCVCRCRCRCVCVCSCVCVCIPAHVNKSNTMKLSKSKHNYHSNKSDSFGAVITSSETINLTLTKRQANTPSALALLYTCSSHIGAASTERFSWLTTPLRLGRIIGIEWMRRLYKIKPLQMLALTPGPGHQLSRSLSSR